MMLGAKRTDKKHSARLPNSTLRMSHNKSGDIGYSDCVWIIPGRLLSDKNRIWDIMSKTLPVGEEFLEIE